MASVWSELKRRNVVRVAVAYAVVGWLLIEIASTILPTFGTPEWVLPTITFLIMLGFPLALVLSWIFDVTPRGLERTGAGSQPENASRVLGMRLDFAIIGALVLTLGFVVYNYESSNAPALIEEAESTSTDEQQRDVLPNSVAVLLCDNLSPNPDDAYFAAGIHDEILNQLFKLGNLTPISRNAVLQYGNNPPPIPQVAEELKVESVMECSVRYAGDFVLVTAQLIDPETNLHLWSDTYEGDLSDVSTLFAIQADIAMNIANALDAEFSAAEQASIEMVPTDSFAAYSLYLQAVASRSAGISALPQDIAILDRAIALDPEFALAYAEKAGRLAGRGRLDPQVEPERERLARESAERALALDSSIALAHAALAALHGANARWSEAQRAYEAAYQLNPNDTLILLSYGSFKRDLLEYDEAIRLLERAAELDPLGNNVQLGITYRLANDYEQAIATFRRTIEFYPADANSHGQLAFAYIAAGNQEEGLRELQIAEELGLAALPFRVPQLAYGYAQLDRREDVERLFGQLQMMEANGMPVSDTSWTQAYLALGDSERAFEHLQSVVNNPAGEFGYGGIQANQFSDPVLDEPRFRELRSNIVRLD